MAAYARLPIVHVHRVEARADRSLGRLAAYDAAGRLAFEGWCLEPPWRENRTGESCIPCGLYGLAPRTSARYGRHLLVEGTEPRAIILFHAGNVPRDTRGCLLPGLSKADVDGDGVPDVASSRSALVQLLAVVSERGRLLITRG